MLLPLNTYINKDVPAALGLDDGLSTAAWKDSVTSIAKKKITWVDTI